MPPLWPAKRLPQDLIQANVFVQSVIDGAGGPLVYDGTWSYDGAQEYDGVKN